MTKEDLIECGIIRIEDGKFTKPAEVEGLFKAYARLVEKRIPEGGAEAFNSIKKTVFELKGNTLEGIVAVNNAVAELLIKDLDTPEKYKEALRFEKLEDKVKESTGTYLGEREKIDFMENCIKDKDFYEYVCATRGQNVMDKNFRAVIEGMYEEGKVKFRDIQSKFFDLFVEYKVEESMRFADVNRKSIRGE